MIAPWTPWELDIVDVLARRVRLMSLVQIGQIWWPNIGSQKALRRELQRLRSSGLVQRTVIDTKLRHPVKCPIALWKPNDIEPNLHAVVQRVRARWRVGGQRSEVYWASPQAANLFGSNAGQLPGELHRDHDLLLSDVYVIYRRQHPDLAHRWGGEAMFSKAGFQIKDPDAFLFDDSGMPTRVIESAGKYGFRQIESFHQHCVDHDLPYELW
jgi:hypothetical protein